MKTTLKANPELFVIPEEDRSDSYFLYAPLSGSIARVNSGTVNLLHKIDNGQEFPVYNKSVVRKLKKQKFLVTQAQLKKFEKQRAKQETTTEYKPTSVTLMPTFDCNLRCTYCYSRAGEDAGKDMSSEIARACIDLIIDNAQETKTERVHLGFHGGGEPFYPRTMPLVKEATEYFNQRAEKAKLKARITSATNGVITPNNLEWIIGNIDRLNISLDGTEDIQNQQRPLRNNKDSYQKVLRTIQTLEELGFPYGIRTTITQASVSKMPELVEHFRQICPSVERFHLEPLFECGRCRTSSEKAPSEQEFLANLIKAQQKAKELGIEIHYSGAKLENISPYFCGATGRNFFITPSGSVTTCLEVCRDDDEMQDIFIIGKYDPKTKQFSFDQEKIDKLKQRSVENIPYCADCFAKYNCSGDCLAKTYAKNGNLAHTSENYRCSVNRGLLVHEFKEKLGPKQTKSQ